MTPVTIDVRDHGPYRVTGPVRIRDLEGNVLDLAAGQSAALCRCGRSGRAPFCDAAEPADELRSCRRTA